MFVSHFPRFAAVSALLLIAAAPHFAVAAPPYPTPAPSPSGSPAPGAAWSDGGSTTPLSGPQVAITYNDGLNADGLPALPDLNTLPGEGFHGVANTHYWQVTTDSSQPYGVTPNAACVKFTQYYLADPFQAEDGDAMIIMPLVDPVLYFDVTLVNRTDLASSLYPDQGPQYWTSYTLSLPDVPGVSFAADTLTNPSYFTGDSGASNAPFSSIVVSPDRLNVTFTFDSASTAGVPPSIGPGSYIHLRYAILFPDPQPGQATGYSLNFRPNVSNITATPEPGLLAFASSGAVTLGAGIVAGRKRRRKTLALVD